MTRVLTLDTMGNQSGGKGSCLKQSSVLGSTVEQARRKYIMTMSLNEIFYKVEKHLLKQNEQAKVRNRCKYRTSSGLSCAVGCLIPDEMYTNKIENMNVARLPLNIIKPIVGVQRDKVEIKLELLENLQEIHDNILPIRWPTHLADIKTEFGIN